MTQTAYISAGEHVTLIDGSSSQSAAFFKDRTPALVSGRGLLLLRVSENRGGPPRSVTTLKYILKISIYFEISSRRDIGYLLWTTQNYRYVVFKVPTPRK